MPGYCVVFAPSLEVVYARKLYYLLSRLKFYMAAGSLVGIYFLCSCLTKLPLLKLKNVWMQKGFIKSMLIAGHACIEKEIIFSHIQNFVRFECWFWNSFRFCFTVLFSVQMIPWTLKFQFLLHISPFADQFFGCPFNQNLCCYVWRRVCIGLILMEFIKIISWWEC